MSNRFICECGRTWEIHQVGQFGETTTRRERHQRQQVQRYHSTVEALAPQPNAPDLLPGETYKTATPMRAQDLVPDVTVPFLQAVMYGGGAALVSIPFAISVEAIPWYTPLSIWAIVTGGAMFITPQWARKLLMRVEEWTGVDINQDGQVGDKPPIPIEHRRDRDGKAHRQLDAIPCPKVGEEKLAEWFRLILRSEGEGFSIRIAKQYRITDVEVRKIQTWFLTRRPPQAVQLGNNWIRPNDEGVDTMWGVVTRYFPNTTLPPDREGIVKTPLPQARTQTHTG